MRIRYLWFSVAAGAACGAAAYFLKKKLAVPARSGASSAALSAAGPADTAAVSASASVREAAYSFISGFKDASTVEFHFSYDPSRFQYAVAEDEFLAESGDSHVGILTGDAFSVQVEYGTYYSGEDFALLSQELTSRHPDLGDAVFVTLSGVKYRDGDHFCLAFPIPDDTHSYLLLTVIKAPDNDDELESIPDSPDFRALLDTASFSRN